MKKRIQTFVAGMLTTALIGGLTVTALAATGTLTIEVNPINVQVNGTTFAPTDAQGNSVPVFSYNGTTYAPLRALAEAYGLEVGYDQGKNMATVGEKAAGPTPDTTTPPADYADWTAEEEKAYQEFKGMWEVELTGTNYGRNPDDPSVEVKTAVYYCAYKGTDGVDNLKTTLVNNPEVRKYYERMCNENIIDDCPITVLCFGTGVGPSNFDNFGRAILTQKQFYIVGWNS